jgi:hypothetical protein
MVNASTQDLSASAGISRARAGRRPQPGPGALPAVLAVIAFIALAVCFSLVGFGLLSTTITPRPGGAIKPVTVASTPSTTPKPDHSSEAAALQTRIAALQNDLARLDIAADQMRVRKESLDQHRKELESLVKQTQAALAEAEVAAQRSAAQQKDAAVRRDQLLAEAADLERRIAELEAATAQAQRVAAARSAQQSAGPHLIECVRDGVLLQPQHVLIPTSALNDGTLAAAVRGRRVYFLVRPDGFSSFVLARSIGRANGAIITAEPRAKD